MKFTDWKGAIINSDREDGDSIISFKGWQPIAPARGDCLRFSPIVVYYFYFIFFERQDQMRRTKNPASRREPREIIMERSGMN